MALRSRIGGCRLAVETRWSQPQRNLEQIQASRQCCKSHVGAFVASLFLQLWLCLWSAWVRTPLLPKQLIKLLTNNHCGQDGYVICAAFTTVHVHDSHVLRHYAQYSAFTTTTCQPVSGSMEPVQCCRGCRCGPCAQFRGRAVDLCAAPLLSFWRK